MSDHIEWKSGDIDKLEIAIAMQRKGYTQSTLAEALGMSRVSLNRKMNNVVQFNAVEIFNMSALLGIDMQDMFIK